MKEVAGVSETFQGSPARKSCILYQNEAKNVTLLDLPHSVSFAQLDDRQQHLQELISCEPLEKPYEVTEPKSDLASRRIKNRSDSLTEAAEHDNLIQAGLDTIRKGYAGSWCLARVRQSFDYQHQTFDQKRKIDDTTSSNQAEEPQLHSKKLTGVARSTEFPTSHALSISSTEYLQNQCLINPHCFPCTLHFSASDASYMIPPYSTFLNTSLSANTSSLLSIALLSAAPHTSSSAEPGEFDLIVLDPPWPNRSARRAAAYRRTSHAEDSFCGFGDILPQHLATNGFVACWITHAQAVRDTVEELFDSWDIEIVEEWTWAKVTLHGEPVIALSSQWRRGWEVLIIGRKRPEGTLERESRHKPVRRLIVAVPDLHSRKPCLKELFEQMLLQRTNARTLEVFARHLVAGWCSIGGEVLRFNWSGHWTISEN